MFAKLLSQLPLKNDVGRKSEFEGQDFSTLDHWDSGKILHLLPLGVKVVNRSPPARLRLHLSVGSRSFSTHDRPSLCASAILVTHPVSQIEHPAVDDVRCEIAELGPADGGELQLSSSSAAAPRMRAHARQKQRGKHADLEKQLTT